MRKRSKPNLLRLFATSFLGAAIIMGVCLLLAWAMRVLPAICFPESKVVRLLMSFIGYVIAAMGSASCIVFLYIRFREAFKYIVNDETRFDLLGILTPRKKAERWIVVLGWWIPRKYRAAIVGDILEDCREMRERNCGECRIRIQVLWQWAIAVVTLVPTGVFAVIWRMLSPPK